jgi:broad specificity phosphatase PhoE
LPTRLLLSRHGETTANVDRIFSGHTDVTLTPLGRRQARALGRRIRLEPVTAAYASDLTRARGTAELALRGRGIEVRTDPALREFHFGEWEGLAFHDVRARYPEHWQRFMANDEGFFPPGGELIGAIRLRATAALGRIVAAHPDETVLVVTHGATLQTIFADILGMSSYAMFRIATGNCGLSIVEYHDDRPLIRLLNDESHLARLLNRQPPLPAARTPETAEAAG